MNFSDVLKALNCVSAFELYRMRAAIDRVLDEPRWILAVRSHLAGHRDIVGLYGDYFNWELSAVVSSESGLLIHDAPGATKAEAAKTFIASSLGIEAQVEQAWPLVGPLFNALVALVKEPKTA